MAGSKDGSHSSIEKEKIEHSEHARVRGQPRTPLERQVALKAALEVDPGVARFSLRAFQMYLVTLIVCCCSGDSGFDGTVMGGINTMAQYQHYFGLQSVGSKTSIVFGIFTIGSICGTIPASYLPDKFGRRFSMFFGNLVLCVGAVMTANAKQQPMFLGGRFLTGLGSTCAGASAKSYLAEITPPQSRGAYLGFLNSFYYVGQMAATGMMVATGRWQNEMSWRLPLYIQLVPAALNVLFIFLCPESPRWLYSIGKSDQARHVLAKFHSSNGNPKSPLVDLEMEEIEEKIEVDGADKTWWDFRPLFTTRADRYRAYMVILIGAFGQLSGNGLITYFLPVLLQNAGITNQNRRLTLNFVNSVTSYIGALSGSAIIDRFGRRKILLTSTAMIAAILAIVTGLLSSNGNANAAQANAGITFVFLFMVVFSFGWTPMQALYPAEVLSYQARAKGLAFLGICAQVATLINTFGLPVALEKIGWKVYVIFLVWDVFEVIVIYFFLVETKGLTLEEINEVFEQPNPRVYSEQLQREAKHARESNV
ncbi:putative general substrate transporter [Lyophyllum shimeji]|uniref:General substrate transporter n=1 Tax=Lyophyllum shimeji TaxID=47721 RepID=A0A9P3UM88_LYOSH|nr:putative general substrate transporter [Lyophyllum shimeji]